MNDQQRPWRVRMKAFVAFMRSKGHRCIWLHHGQLAKPIGVIPSLKFHGNDNRRNGENRK